MTGERRPVPAVRYVPGGVRDYDHTRYVGLPEYRALRRALNDFLDAAGVAHGLTMGGALQVVTDLTYGVRYPDSCDDRAAHLAADGWIGGDTIPVRVVSMSAEWLNCAYWCPECRRPHRSGYSRGAAEVAF